MQLRRMRTELLQKQFQAHSLVVDLIIFIFQFIGAANQRTPDACWENHKFLGYGCTI